jgi:hypothetical protein
LFNSVLSQFARASFITKFAALPEIRGSDELQHESVKFDPEYVVFDAIVFDAILYYTQYLFQNLHVKLNYLEIHIMIFLEHLMNSCK